MTIARVPNVDVVIPTLNEQDALPHVLKDIPSWVRRVVVADNGSTDSTADTARAFGAQVVRQPRRGYGAACMTALAILEDPDVVVFLDADRSDAPSEMWRLVEPIVQGRADLVIGSRTLGEAEPASLTTVQGFGNRLACGLIRRAWGVECTDLGPFRAVRFRALHRLAMSDMDNGWTVQMQTRAARHGLRMVEVPITHRRRIDRSKASGTLRGVLGAGSKIIGTVLREAIADRFRSPRCERLIVFTRYPEAGRAKTRLIPALGPDAAAQLQREMTRHTLEQARRWERIAGRKVEVRYTGCDAEDMAAIYGADLTYTDQGNGDLGERLQRAFHDAHQSRCDAAVAIGCDCPDLDASGISEAFAALRAHDVVLGPAVDGGYYLIGLTDSIPSLFREIDWGTGRVLEQTQAAIRSAGLRATSLNTLGDVDEPEDLALWDRTRERVESGMASPAVSVIIPTLNEGEGISDTIRSLGPDRDLEVIVADGGSTDDTTVIAEGLGARVVKAPRGRARQLNAGAAAATTGVLLFLHADTRLPFGWRKHVEQALARAGTAAGAFRLAFDDAGPALRMIEFGANVRSVWRRMPYGDQAIFMQREQFEAIDGFRDMPVMEDYDLVRRLRRRGRIEVAESAVITSARRWRTEGTWRTTIRHQVAILAYHLGVEPERLARFLRRPLPASRPKAQLPKTSVASDSACSDAGGHPQDPHPQGAAPRPEP